MVHAFIISSGESLGLIEKPTCLEVQASSVVGGADLVLRREDHFQGAARVLIEPDMERDGAGVGEGASSSDALGDSREECLVSVGLLFHGAQPTPVRGAGASLGLYK